MSNDTWYLAYGSNMSVDRKQDRTGTIRKALRCRLDGYRLAFNKRASGGGVYANIMPDATGEVWGVAYLCDETAMRTLDNYEGVAGGHYERTSLIVEDSSRNPIHCVAYIAGPNYVVDDGKPSAEYLDYLLSGAREHDLPSWYIDDIQRLGKAKSP